MDHHPTPSLPPPLPRQEVEVEVEVRQCSVCVTRGPRGAFREGGSAKTERTTEEGRNREEGENNREAS